MEDNMTDKTKVSVIIPCYNQGEFLKEAVDSVLASDYKNIEIIIVNDGSDDGITEKVLESINHPLVKIIHQQNQGLPSARNNGINASSGKYILPLDADDKIHPSYISKAVKILDNKPDIGVVYCNYQIFGDYEMEEKIPVCTPITFLLRNICVVCSMFRKDDFIKVKGYKDEMKDGYEDWEFWVSMYENGVKFEKINETLFYYRSLNKESMVKKFQRDRYLHLKTHKKIMKLHPELYIDNLEKIIFDLLLNYLYAIPMETKINCTIRFLTKSFKPKNVLQTLKRILNEKLGFRKFLLNKNTELLITDK